MECLVFRSPRLARSCRKSGPGRLAASRFASVEHATRSNRNQGGSRIDEYLSESSIKALRDAIRCGTGARNQATETDGESSKSREKMSILWEDGGSNP